MPCRTAPEIDEERQRFLAGRRAVQPGIVKGNYPFRDERGSIRLTGAGGDGGSLFLGLIFGYGYRPLRSFLTYALAVSGFAAAYFVLGGSHGQPLAWNEAIVVSMTTFHGRGFFGSSFQPGDVQVAVAAIKAFIGLLIEIVLIATFTQRLFTRRHLGRHLLPLGRGVVRV